MLKGILNQNSNPNKARSIREYKQTSIPKPIPKQPQQPKEQLQEQDVEKQLAELPQEVQDLLLSLAKTQTPNNIETPKEQPKPQEVKTIPNIDAKPNYVKQGKERDKKILETTAELGALDSEQICRLFFSNIKYGKKKAQERLRKLFEKGKLNRCAIDRFSAYCYYLEKKPAQLEHIILTNWTYIYFLESLPSYEKITSYNREYTLGNVRADGFLEIKNTTTNKYRYIFIEVERAESRNQFNKVQIYNDLYESGEFEKASWVYRAEKFPQIYIFTNTTTKLKSINNSVLNENRYGLKFYTKLIGEVIKEGDFQYERKNY